MTLKTMDYTITDEGRDKGKVFRITEMTAARGEDFAIRALLAMSKSGVQIPEDAAKMGFAAIMLLGFRALTNLSYGDLKPLLDEMFTCISVVRDRAHPEMTFALLESDIEEIQTRLTLRKAVWDLHASFFRVGGEAISSQDEAPKFEASSPIQTSQPRLVRSSRAAKRP